MKKSSGRFFVNNKLEFLLALVNDRCYYIYYESPFERIEYDKGRNEIFNRVIEDKKKGLRYILRDKKWLVAYKIEDEKTKTI